MMMIICLAKRVQRAKQTNIIYLTCIADSRDKGVSIALHRQSNAIMSFES